jgi:hypothetical protein
MSGVSLDVYLDESSEGGHRFTVIGGVAVPTAIAADRSSAIQACKKHPKSELKWNRIDKTNCDLYAKVIDCFLESRNRKQIHFHCIVIDNSRVNHALYNFGDVDLGFNKFIYQIAMKFARHYERADRIYVYPDERRTSQTGQQFRDVLNNGAAKKLSRKPFRLVEFRKSKDCPLVQLADVLLGAIAYEANDHCNAASANKGKLAVLNHIKTSLSIDSFKVSTPYAFRTFTVWYLRLS